MRTMDPAVNHISGLSLSLACQRVFKGDTYSSARALIKAAHTASSHNDVTSEEANRLTTAGPSHIVLQ